MPKLRNPYFVVAWPGMGQVAFNAVRHIIRVFACYEFAYIDSKSIFYPTHISINKGLLKSQELPYNRFYYWKNRQGNNDLLLFLSNAQPDLAKSKDYSKAILRLAKELDTKILFSFASMPLPIDHIQRPNIWITATTSRLLQALKKDNFKILSEGKISGMNGLILGQAKEVNIEGVCLLAEIPIYTIQIDNPKASLALLDEFSRMVNIPIDTKDLQKDTKQVEAEINKLIDHLKSSIQPNPIEEEEVEHIKKSLSLNTRIPNSAVEKIEKLFLQANKDITKAYELKKELDKWNIYKEYEDRFLDLFKKLKKNN